MRKNWLKSGLLMYWRSSVGRKPIERAYGRLLAKLTESKDYSDLAVLRDASASKIIALAQDAGLEIPTSPRDLARTALDEIRSIESDKAIYAMLAGISVSGSHPEVRALAARIDKLEPRRVELERAACGNAHVDAFFIALNSLLEKKPSLGQYSPERFRNAVLAFALLGLAAHRWGPQMRCRTCPCTSIPGHKYCGSHRVSVDGIRQDRQRRHANRAMVWLKKNNAAGYDVVREHPGKFMTISDVISGDLPNTNNVISGAGSEWTWRATRRSLLLALRDAPRVNRLLGELSLSPQRMIEQLRTKLDSEFYSTSLLAWRDKIVAHEAWLEALEQTRRASKLGRPKGISANTLVNIRKAALLLRNGWEQKRVAKKLGVAENTISSWKKRHHKLFD